MEEKQRVIADRIRELLIEKLYLPMKKEDIKYDASFDETIGLDSLDIMELVMAIEAEYNVELKEENRDNFTNLETLSKHILTSMENNEKEGQTT